jgi:hypothetical protein
VEFFFFVEKVQKITKPAALYLNLILVGSPFYDFVMLIWTIVPVPVNIAKASIRWKFQCRSHAANQAFREKSKI